MKWKRVSLVLFIVVFLYFNMFSVDKGRLDIGFDPVVGQGQIEIRLGKIHKTDDGFILIPVTENLEAKTESDRVLFVNDRTVINSDFLQLQAFNIENDSFNGEIEITVRQFTTFVYNESTGDILGFRNLEIWNATLEFMNGQGWTNILLKKTDDVKHVWVTYRNVRIEFMTKTLEENLLAPRMTNSELFNLLINFSLQAVLIALAGGGFGIYFEYRAKEIVIPPKAQTYLWVASLFGVMLFQIAIELIDLDTSRNLFFGMVFLGSMVLGIKSYSYPFKIWLLVGRTVDETGNVVWYFEKNKIYNIGGQDYVLIKGAKYTLYRILGIDVEIRLSHFNFDYARNVDRVYFVIDKPKIKTDGEFRVKYLDVRVRPRHLMKIEESRLETVEIANLEEELHNADIELKRERAKSRAEAYRHRAQTEEVELTLLGLNLWRSGAINEEIVNEIAKQNGKSKDEIVRLLEEEAKQVEQGDLPKNGLSHRLKRIQNKYRRNGR